MQQWVIPLGNEPTQGDAHFDGPSNAIWLATTSGRILTVRLLDDRVALLGSGYGDPVAVLPVRDGLTMVVIERQGRVLLARRDFGARQSARLVVDLAARVLSARRSPDVETVVVLTVDEENSGSLLAVDLADGATTVIARGLDHAQTFVVDEQRREVVVLSVDNAAQRSLTVVGLDDGVTVVVAGQLPALSSITSSPDGAIRAVLGATAAGQITLIHLDGTTEPAVDMARPVSALARWGSLLLTVSGTDLVAVEWNLDSGLLPVQLPLGPVFVNGYTRVTVDAEAVGLSLDDIDLAVREGVEAGALSAGLEPEGGGRTREFVLLAGVHPGEYHLEARRQTDGAVLAVRRFRVTSCWPDSDVGPPVQTTGKRQLHSLMNWGGTGAGAEYFAVAPAPSVWRLAVVLVATSDRRWDAGLEPAKAAWRDRVEGAADSAKRFFEEVSYRTSGAAPDPQAMTVELAGGRVLGPVDLAEGWGDVFEPKKAGDLNAGWRVKTSGRGILAGAISTWMADQPDGHAIMASADSIAIITRSGSDKPTPMVGSVPAIPTRYVWGHAPTIDFWRKDPATSTYTAGPKPVVLMTDVYPDALPIKPILQRTLCHELGHNLGLDDLYDAKGDYPEEIDKRSPANADLMASSVPLPHFSLANRIRLGWVRREWLRRFDFSAVATGGDVILQAVEKLGHSGPRPGYAAGIEIPVADGWSYFFELRQEQADQVGDRSLERLSTTERLILGTDVRASGGMVARPPILLLPADADGVGPVLDTVGEDYRDSDTTNPARMHDFTLRLDGLGAPDPDTARVSVSYIGAHRPQLQVRSAPGRGNFKSPDIELVGPFGPACFGAVKGATNTLAVTVHNLGTLAATDVQVHVKWMPFTVSGGDWITLPDPATFSVPARGSTAFAMAWPIPASVKVDDVEAEHFCVRVDIDRYRDPTHPEQDEIVVADNWAQSNFDTTVVSFGSPSQRVRTVLTISNPLTRQATFLLGADQSSDWYRLYLGNAWLRLPPGETRSIELAYESLAGDPLHGVDFQEHVERIIHEPAHVGVTSWLVPEATECDTPREWWGVGLDLQVGRRCWFEDVRRDGELVTASVLTVSGDQTVRVTSGDIYLAAWPEDEPDHIATTEGSIQDDGQARVLLSSDTLRLLSDGHQIVGKVARGHDVHFAQAISKTIPLV